VWIQGSVGDPFPFGSSAFLLLFLLLLFLLLVLLLALLEVRGAVLGVLLPLVALPQQPLPPGPFLQRVDEGDSSRCPVRVRPVDGPAERAVGAMKGQRERVRVRAMARSCPRVRERA